MKCFYLFLYFNLSKKQTKTSIKDTILIVNKLTEDQASPLNLRRKTYRKVAVPKHNIFSVRSKSVVATGECVQRVGM